MGFRMDESQALAIIRAHSGRSSESGEYEGAKKICEIDWDTGWEKPGDDRTFAHKFRCPDGSCFVDDGGNLHIWNGPA